MILNNLELEQRLNDIVWQSVAQERKITPCHTNRASELGHDCIRYLYLNRVRWSDKLLHDITLQWIFNEGIMHETAVEDRLRKAGFILTQSQRSCEAKEQNVTGHIDGFISHPEYLKESVPMEIKGLSVNNWSSINSYDDMINHKQWYIRKYPAQLQIYMYLTERDKGLFILKNKGTGVIKFISIDLDYDYVESLLKKAEKVNDYVIKNVLPDETTQDAKICGSCPFRLICFGDKDGHPGIIILQDAVIEQSVNRMQEIKQYADEYDDLKESVGNSIKSRAMQERDKEGKAEYFIGDYVLRASKVNGTKYNIPKEIKTQYAEPNQYWKFGGIIKIN